MISNEERKEYYVNIYRTNEASFKWT